jgi:hypothetical protein
LFVDPVADIAVLASPDRQDLSKLAGAYDRLIDTVIPLQVSEPKSEKVNAQLLPGDNRSVGRLHDLLRQLLRCRMPCDRGTATYLRSKAKFAQQPAGQM